MHAEIKAEALRLYNIGFSVIPTAPYQKQPAVPWSAYQNRRANTAEIESWWSEKPGRAPFGLAVVSGAISSGAVLDFDPVTEDDLDRLLLDTERFLGFKIPETCCVKTPNGGMHMHYYLNAPAPSKKLLFQSEHGHVEFRADGSICVVPPTEIIKKDGTRGTYTYTGAVPIENRTDITKTPLWSVVLGTQTTNTAKQPAAPPAQAEILETVKKALPHISEEAKKIFYSKRIPKDRSALCWKLAVELVKSGITDQHTIACFLMCTPAHKDKYSDPSRGTSWGEWGHAWHAAGKAVAQFAAAAAAAAAATTTNINGTTNGKKVSITLVPLSEIEREPVEFLINPIIPRGEVTIIDGDPAVGKSWVWMALAAGLTGSPICPVPYDYTAPKDAKIIILTTEDSPSKTIRGRLEDLGADLSRIKLFKINGEPGSIMADTLLEVIPIIEEEKPDMVVIDPLTLFVSTKHGFDINNATAVRQVFNELTALARKLNIAIVVVRHFRKAGGKAIHKGMGSIDHIAASRSGLIVALDKDTGKRVVVHNKANLTQQLKTALVFSLDQNNTPPFKWEDMYAVDPDKLTNDDHRYNNQPSDNNTSKLEAAKDFLTVYLSDAGGTAQSKEVMQAAKQNGFSERTIWRAKDDLGINHIIQGARQNRQCFWVLPKHLVKQ